MQDNMTADQDIGQTAKIPKTNWKWGWGCIGVIVACVVIYFAVRFFGGYMPVSTLHVKELPTFASLLEVCGNATDKWPLSLQNPNRKFPAYSPDRKWYITVGSVTYRAAEEVRLYDAESNRIVGSYSFYRLSLACWAEDSRGVYLEDWIPGSLFDFPVPTWYSNPKEILVPTLGITNGATP